MSAKKVSPKLLKALLKFRDSAQELNAAWDGALHQDAVLDDDVLVKGYPFKASFEEVVVGIEEWAEETVAWPSRLPTR